MPNQGHEANDPPETNGPSARNGPAPGDGVRIGHEERQNAADNLAEHFAAGRLEQSEFEDRTGAVWQAKTLAELQPLFFDLPGGSLNGFLTSQAASGTERSSRAPATVDSENSGEPARSGDDEARTAWKKVLTILMGIFPILMLLAFFGLRAVGVEQAWLVFLLVPIFYVTTGVLMSDDDDDDDDENGDDDDEDGSAHEGRAAQ